MKELHKLRKMNKKLEKITDEIYDIKDDIKKILNPKIELMRKIQLEIFDKTNNINKNNNIRVPIRKGSFSVNPCYIQHIPDIIDDFKEFEDMTTLEGTKYFSGCGDEYVSIKIPTEYLEMSLDEIKSDYTKRFQSEVDSIVKEEEEKILERKKQEFEKLKKELEK
jgi:hypothetical protein